MLRNVSVTLRQGQFAVATPFALNYLAKEMPNRTWSRTDKVWIGPINKANARYLNSAIPDEQWSVEARQAAAGAIATGPVRSGFPTAYDFGSLKPMSQQSAALDAAYGNKGYALFMEMGTGKTFTALHLAQCYFMEGAIDQLQVVCPVSIKGVWQREHHKFLRHHNKLQIEGMPIRGTVPINITGTESLSAGSAYESTQAWVRGGKTMLVVDESSKIKNHKAKRTQRTWELSRMADYKLILTGTPITQGIQDLYAQFYALDPDIIGHKSYYTFRNRYCIMGGFQGRQLIGYQKTEELIEYTKPYVYQVTKEECLDLPDKIYMEPWEVKLSKEQTDVIKELKKAMRVELDGQKLTVENTIGWMTRAQQIVGGNYPYLDDEEVWQTRPLSKNPKLEELCEILAQLPADSQAIIWSRFRPEIAAIGEDLRSVGYVVGELHGGIKPDDRQQVVDSFQRGETQFLVANQATGGMGLTLTAATTVIYFSNTFSYEERVQSEDRAHRIGQNEHVTYINLLSNAQIDKTVMAILEKKTDLAGFVKDAMAGDLI